MDGNTVMRWVPIVVGTVIAALLLWFIFTGGASFDWWALAKAAAAVALGLATVFLLGLALRRPGDLPLRDQDAVRNRIAPMIIGIGAAGIVILAIVVMALVFQSTGEDRTATLSVFTAVLPVFATWVGTVIAFYFSSESYRQAAQAARQQIADPGDDAIAARMLPFDKITKLVLGKDNIPADAKAVPMGRVRALFGDTITRVIIFDAESRPVYILRKKLDAPQDTNTIGDYLAKDGRLADATNFTFLPAQATVADGRRALKLYTTVDVFVTDHGAGTEPVRGWVADDRLA